VTSYTIDGAIDAWRRRRERDRTGGPADDDFDAWSSDVEDRLRYGAVTARSAGLYSCPSCGLLSRRSADGEDDGADGDVLQVDCPRCGEPLHLRKPHAVGRTWAYIIAALILYIPANLLPITDTHTLFDDETDTIFSGVIHLWQAGSWPLALLVFFASITVPLAKLIVLTGLNISVQRDVLRKPRQRTMLFRIVEFIGRWSMLDIFAVAILTALVQLKSLAEVTAGPAVLAFGAVCVLTILASHAFDPRLIWDPIDVSQADPDREDD
jgi:paraquat-inducible protein A